MIGNPGRTSVPPLAAVQPVLGTEGLGPNLCFACRKCSGGCPVVEDMDIAPHQIIGMVRAGLETETLRSSAIWLCTSCQTCTTRCPNGVDVAGVIGALKQRATAARVRAGDRQIAAFHQAFLESVKARGRIYELGLIARYALKTRRPPGGLRLGARMARKGKLQFSPGKKTATREIRQLFKLVKGRAR